jgi:hypothetical protein
VSATISTTDIDVSTGPEIVTFEFEFADSGTGVQSIFASLQNLNFEQRLSTNSFNSSVLTVPYIAGLTSDATIRLGNVSANDVANNGLFLNNNDLPNLAVNITGIPPVTGVQSGTFDDVQGDFYGAPGAPSYQFTVNSDDTVAIARQATSGTNFATLRLLDAGGNEIAVSSFTGSDQFSSVGAALTAGSYIVTVGSCCGHSDTFDLDFYGDVSNIQLDTDSDGDPDVTDSDDDNDGFYDAFDNFPLIRGQQ